MKTRPVLCSATFITNVEDVLLILQQKQNIPTILNSALHFNPGRMNSTHKLKVKVYFS